MGKKSILVLATYWCYSKKYRLSRFPSPSVVNFGTYREHVVSFELFRICKYLT